VSELNPDSTLRENYKDVPTPTKSYTRLFTYDTVGNMLTSTTYEYLASGTPPSSTKHGEEVTYTYNPSGQWKDQLTKTVTKTYNKGTLSGTVNSPAYNYDANGNMLTRPGTGNTLTWIGNRLTSVGGAASFSYDKNDLRTKKTDTSGKGWQYYYNGGQLEKMEGTGGNAGISMSFTYDATGKPWYMDYVGNGLNTYYYFEYDAQGNVFGILNSSATRVVEYGYDAWGKPLYQTGTLSSTVGTNQPFRYRGYVYDVETGWYYLKSRYYDPSIRRFISSDKLVSTGQGLLGWNMYAY